MKIEPFDIKETLGFHIAVTHFHMRKRLAFFFKQCGFDISPDQWSVLACLSGREPMSQREIAQYLEKDTASITRIIDILQSKGLILRGNSTEDRRIFLIELTEKGQEVARELNQRIKEVGKSAKLSEEENQTLKRLLQKLRG